MVKITVSVVSNKLPGMAALARAGIGAAVAKAVADVESQAKTRAPVDTGTLRNSIAGSMTGPTAGEVSTGVEYAQFQEYGTVFQPGQAFMRPAAEAVKPSFEAAIKQAIAGL